MRAWEILMLITVCLGCREGGSIEFKKSYSNDNSLVQLSDEPAGKNCQNGGVRIDSGLDNGDGGGVVDDHILESGEIDQTKYVCTGSTGTNGAVGNTGSTGSIGATGATGTSGVNGVTAQQISKASQLNVVANDGTIVGDFVYEDINVQTLQVYNPKLDAFIYYNTIDTTPTLSYPVASGELLWQDSNCKTNGIVTTVGTTIVHKGKFAQLYLSANSLAVGQSFPATSDYPVYVFDASSAKIYSGLYRLNWTNAGATVTGITCTPVADALGYAATLTTEVKAQYSGPFEFKSKQ